MESPNCTAILQSIVLPPSLSSTSSTSSRMRRPYNENSLNAALSAWYHPSRSDGGGSLLRNGIAVPSLQSYNRSHGNDTSRSQLALAGVTSSRNERSLSDILDEAINLSNEYLLQRTRSVDDATMVPSHQQDIIVPQQQQRPRSRKGKRLNRRRNLPQ